MNPNIFREYDIRGIAERDLTDELAESLGRAFGTKLREKGGRTVAVGEDVRESSPRLVRGLSAGLRSTGCEVIRVGVVPTPALYYAVVHFGTDGGVMVTGSHNPIEYNGFKVQIGPESLHGEEIQDLRRRIEQGEFLTGSGSERERLIRDDYETMVVERCRPVRPLRIVADAGNGVAGPIAVSVLRKLGHTVFPLYCEPDGRFPNHQPDPTVLENMLDLIELVKREKADLGVGYDGDADRLGVVDETGVLLWGDQLLALFARDVLVRVPGAPIVFDVKCSQGLEEDIVAHGGRPIMWKTGHSLSKAKMKAENAPVAGEMSGHMFFNEGFFGHDDAIYGSARFAAIIAASGRPVSTHRLSLPQYVNSPEIRVDCTDEAKFRIVETVARDFAREYPVNAMDGARVTFPEGWGLLRASNTQPVLVLRFEARTAEGFAAIERRFRQALAVWPEVLWPPAS
ncbi:MAG: phosphomannomutase/phosphoglucomutase [Candidatus Eisenbacteria bacterium]|nr:phosphomannomutase/phosphoglucomutase [Candidatus Eisenbacteria bacterium]